MLVAWVLEGLTEWLIERMALLLEVPDQQRGSAVDRSPAIVQAWRKDPRKDVQITKCSSSRSFVFVYALGGGGGFLKGCPELGVVGRKSQPL